MAEIIGTPFDDQLVDTSVVDGPTGEDGRYGLAGNDRTGGRSANDRRFGGLGDDQLTGSLGDELPFGDENDEGGPRADAIFGGIARVAHSGAYGDDLRAGDERDDDLLDGADDDRLDDDDDDDAGDDLAAPVARDDSAATNQSTAVTIDLLANDQGRGDRLTITGLDTTGTRGTIAIDPDGQTVTYAPDPTFFGIDRFGYTVANSLGGTDEATVSVGVLGVLTPDQIDGTNGFRIAGIAAGDQLGFAVGAAGDLNRDGFDDLIVGAPGADPSGRDGAGASFVVFGGPAGFEPVFDLATLDGGNGFRLDGITAGDRSGAAVSGAGDFNGDDLPDLIIGAPGANPVPDTFDRFDGEAYLIFAPSGIGSPNFSLSVLNGANGVRLVGGLQGRTGSVVSSAGDFTGDGLSDIVVGAPGTIPGSTSPDTGSAYLLFGSTSTFDRTFNLSNFNGDLTQSNSLTVEPPSRGAATGRSASGAGDVNADGFQDTIVTSPGTELGLAQVLFGGPGPYTSLAAFDMDGSNGFNIIGLRDPSSFGSASGAGDFNGDGFADLIVGEPGGHFFDDAFLDARGASFVVFGGVAFEDALQLGDLDGNNGFRLDGVEASEHSGAAVSGVGDFNGDGFDDVIIGTDPIASLAGRAYVVFGAATGFGVSFDLADLDGSNGFLIQGTEPGDRLGAAVSEAGDINGDGFADLIVGAPEAGSSAGSGASGESFVVFGGDFTASVDQLGGAGDDRLVGTAADEIIFGAQGGDVLIGNGGQDLLNGGAGDDLLAAGDVDFRKVLGGSGTDTLRLDGASEVLDLTAISDLFVHDVERIDLNGNDNALVLDRLEILNIDDNSNVLRVLGDADNAVRGDLTGAAVGQTTIGGVTFDSFTVGNAELLVQSTVDTTGIVV